MQQRQASTLTGAAWLATLIALGAAVLGSTPAAGADLGSVGPSYPIAEPDLLAEIQAVLKRKEASGELALLQREAQQRAMRGIESPKPVAGLARTTKARTHYFDPSITIEDAITDGQGKVVVPAGTRHNPLDTVTLTRQMLFFDAMRYFGSQNLVPVARDFEAPHQYNLVYLSKEVLLRPNVRLLLARFLRGD